MDRDLQRTMYNGFFNEMMEIQKEAGFLKHTLQGAKRIWANPTKQMGVMQKAFQTGAGRAGGQGAGWLGRTASGVGSVLRTRPGKAVAAGVLGAGALGAGAMGTGYMAGRAR